MVSRSTTWISPKPVVTRFLSSSQPMPPAPTTRIRDCQKIRRTRDKILRLAHLLDVSMKRAKRLLQEPIPRHFEAQQRRKEKLGREGIIWKESRPKYKVMSERIVMRRESE